MESARRATSAELDRVAELWREGVTELDHQRGGPLLAGTLLANASGGAQPVADWLLASLTDPDRILVVGLVDEVVLGFGAAHVDRNRHDAVAAVDMLHVEPAARGIGVGEAVLQVILEWAGQHGVHGVDAPALPGSRIAKAFFETHGFTARLLTMHRPLHRDDG